MSQPALPLARRLVDIRHPLGFSVVNTFSGLTGLPPATALNLAAGSYHGVLFGTCLFSLTATLGAAIGLIIVRLLLRDLVLRWMSKHRGKADALDTAIRKEGATLIVGLLRLSPVIPFMPTTMLLALTDAPTIPFLIGTLLGVVPFAFLYSYMGVAGKQLLNGGFRNPKTILLALVTIASTVALTVKINAVVSNALSAAEV
jgi:uncharacterized membrane protein YdjX (TVP38/TMEM64 family)